MDRITLSGCGLLVEIGLDGAELRSLRDEAGNEYLWQALPVWPRHAPVLFPIVGRLKDDTLHHAGKSYRLTQHGFARDRRFSVAESTASSCRLTLVDDAGTRALYPFAFRLELAYALGPDGLSQTFTVTNPGTEVLPASFGAHPAFRWPLREGIAKEAHALTFEHDERALLPRLEGGLLLPPDRPSPVVDGVFALRPELFAGDAYVFMAPASHWVRFAAEGGPNVRVSWRGFRELGIWMRPGGDFLCIEPWLGTASPVDFAGDILDKPGIAKIPPGGSVSASMTMSVSTNA
ncbi:MAG: aldose 1-epimerase family protein [Acidisphaera sp.]|nr:aldose 1-epimerase family protein [Acidisphaera sp.]